MGTFFFFDGKWLLFHIIEGKYSACYFVARSGVSALNDISEFPG